MHSPAVARHRIAAAALTILCAACPAALPADAVASSGSAALLAAEDALSAAFLHADVAALERQLTDDFTLINGRGEVDTKASTIADLRGGAVRYTRFANREQQVRMLGPDAAIVIGITTLAGHAGERSFDAQVRFTDTFVRRDGRWQLAAGQASSPLKP